MRLYDELYFEITVIGDTADIDKFERFLSSGELDEFFEINEEYINRDSRRDGNEEISFSNDDVGTEISSLDVDEFLDLFCHAARALEVRGSLYDSDDNEFSFESPTGDSGYYDINAPRRFNDELDEAAREEEDEEEE